MKKIFLILMFCVFGILKVNASNFYYTNGIIKLTEKEYNFVKEFYDENFLLNMTIEDYYWLEELNINNNDIEIKVAFLEPTEIVLYGANVSSNSKRIAIAKSCYTNYCVITTTITFLVDPNIRSYDVVGARFSGTSLYNKNTTTQVRSSVGTTTYSNYQYLNNGFGNSIKLPDSGNSIIVQQKFYVKPTGTVYASYQHATTSVSLATSQMYFISMIGYGGVFTFTGTAVGVYDATTGVDISL